MFGFRDVEVPRAIVEAGGSRVAAVRTGASQSSPSNRVAVPERRLEARLLDRFGRGARSEPMVDTSVELGRCGTRSPWASASTSVPCAMVRHRDGGGNAAPDGVRPLAVCEAASPERSAGSIAAGGTLGILIPPSIDLAV